MSLLDLLFRTKKPAPLPSGSVTVDLQGPVLVTEDGFTRESDAFSAVQDKLIDAAEQGGLGIFDCNEVEENSARLFFYGEDAERLAEHLQPILQSSLFGTHARFTIRSGEPNAPERIVQL